MAQIFTLPLAQCEHDCPPQAVRIRTKCSSAVHECLANVVLTGSGRIRLGPQPSDRHDADHSPGCTRGGFAPPGCSACCCRAALHNQVFDTTGLCTSEAVTVIPMTKSHVDGST